MGLQVVTPYTIVYASRFYTNNNEPKNNQVGGKVVLITGMVKGVQTSDKDNRVNSYRDATEWGSRSGCVMGK